MPNTETSLDVSIQANCDDMETINEILEQRAIQLARQDRSEELSDENSIQVVEFVMAGETFGIELQYIREVYPLSDFTPLPSTPPFVIGIINVRGQILSIIDLKHYFGIASSGITDLNRVIIVHSVDMEFGILADEIIGVRRVDLQDMQSSLPTLTGTQAEYLLGVTSDRSVILDGNKILTDPHIIVDDAIDK